MRYLLFLSSAKYCGLRVCVPAHEATEENREKDGERGGGGGEDITGKRKK